MVTYFNNILCVSYDELVDREAKSNEVGNGIITQYQFQNYRTSKKITEERRACRGTIALYNYDLLPSHIQDSLKLKYPQGLHKAAAATPIERFLENDVHAYHFFMSFQLPNGKGLGEKTVRTYTANASALNAINRLLNDTQAYRQALGGTKRAKTSLSAIIMGLELLKANWGFKLPSSKRGIRRLLKQYKDLGYEALISGKLCNSNAAKVIEDEQTAALRRILANWRNLDNAQVAKMYNMVAEQAAWKNITAGTVANKRTEWELYVEAGNRGEKHHDNVHGMQVKRVAPKYPLLYWTLDGWDVELMYQKTGLDKSGRSVTTYHNRLNAVIVIDPCTNYPIGYAIAERESPISIKEALRNAVKHVQELFGTYYHPHQIQSDNYGKGHLKPFYEAMSEYYTPAKVGNAKSKIIEPTFGRWNKDFCQMQHNWSGFGITSRKENQPNADWLNKTTVKHTFPDMQGCIQQIERMIFIKRQEAVEAYMEAWGGLPESKKLAWNTSDFLYHTGEVTGYTNQLEGSGLHVTLNKSKRVYDSFDTEFRFNRSQKWVIKYDPQDLENVLAHDEDGKLKFLLSEKYLQPMALAERQDGDAEELHKIFDFNKELKEEILQVQDADYEAMENLYDRIPALQDTLGKFLITDSRGQHKDQKSNARLLEAAAQFEIKQTKTQQKAIKDEVASKREAYINSKIDIDSFYANIK